ncbi:hypothetical protein FKM82_024151 [Ascaphus truei]
MIMMSLMAKSYDHNKDGGRNSYITSAHVWSLVHNSRESLIGHLASGSGYWDYPSTNTPFNTAAGTPLTLIRSLYQWTVLC